MKDIDKGETRGRGWRQLEGDPGEGVASCRVPGSADRLFPVWPSVQISILAAWFTGCQLKVTVG